METANCGVLTPDLFADVAWLVEERRSATPVEFHALNSLVEAVVFHEKLYAYVDVPEPRSLLQARLVDEGLLQRGGSAKLIEEELESRGQSELSRDAFLDRTFGSRFIGYDPAGGIATLSSLIEYEGTLGLARMSRWHDDNESLAIFFASTVRFSKADSIVLDDTYRLVRAFSACAGELGLEMYTGVVYRAFLTGFLSDRRRGSLLLYERMLKELDDLDDTDLPSWRRFEVPPLTQALLASCGDSPEALADELLKLRWRLRKFRQTLTEQAQAVGTATTRGEKRKIRRETENAWRALLDKEDRTTRLSHQVWDVLKNPLKAHITIGDKAVEKDKLDQAILKVQGLTDLWATLRDAPTLECNTSLIRDVFGLEVEASQWRETAKLCVALETVMTRNDEPDLPDGPRTSDVSR